MSALTVIPILIPLGCALASLLARRSIRLQRGLAVAGTAMLLIAAIFLLSSVLRHGVLCTQVGNWPAPFGITLVADILSSVMVMLTGLMGLATAIYSMASMDEARERFGYYPLLHMLLCGVNGAFLTGDLFNLYVWFEVMLIASFVLLALGGERAQMEGAIKYVTLNLMASALFLAGVGILYGMAGTLNMADLSLKLRDTGHAGLITCVAMLFLTAFGVKAALFPVFSWLPASYHTPPVAVSAIFAGLLTKVGVYALLRVFTLIFTQDITYTHTIILWAAGLTMVTGVLGAFAQSEFRRILSFHIISQIGYMIMGLGLYTPLALAGSLFYITHHIVVKTNLFLVSGLAHRLRGSYDLKKLGGLYASAPLVAGLFLIPAMSLAGMPPLSGFFAKFLLVKAGLEAGRWGIVAVALAVGMVTLMSMTKIWAEAFWKAAPGTMEMPRPGKHEMICLLFPVIMLAAVTLAIGVGAGPVLDVANRAAEQLQGNTDYIATVLGEKAR
ncbi:MAG: Na+/H+ antiporter subunit D [Armatimonadota bacterium]